MSRILSFVTAVIAAVVVATPASAHTTSIPRYLVTGIETSVPVGNTSTFAGTAFSLRAGGATWKASVVHQSLAACASLPADQADKCIDGGMFSLTGRRSGTVEGAFTKGSIMLVSGDPVGCTSTTVYDVRGTVDTEGGPATFHVRLTHYQAELRGECIPYFATVVGTFGGS